MGLGGWKDLSSPSPITLQDHPVHEHSLAISPTFLRRSGTTAGYDPSFMAGYPKSVIFPQSSTLYDATSFLIPGVPRPILHKWIVFFALGSIPWVVALAGSLWGLRDDAVAWAVALFLLYVWTNGGDAGFPLNFAYFGMLTYLLAVPVCLVATAAYSRYMARGGMGRWFGAILASFLAFLVHVTAPMIVVPGALLSFLTALTNRQKFPISRYIGAWTVPIFAVALNAFWWLPGVWLWKVKGDTGFAFDHSKESVWTRLAQIVTTAPPIQAVLVGAGLVGIVVLWARDRVSAAGLGGFALAGLAWGYLAGAVPSLDALQPGRHTYALFAGLALLGGLGISEALDRLSTGRPALRLVAAFGLIVFAGRVFGPDLAVSVRSRLGWHAGPGARPFVGSEPTDQFTRLIAWIRSNVKPGERLYYEEAGGEPLPGDPEPFGGHRYSGVLPEMTGVEVIGGPYLKASVVQNFTQIGSGLLFGKPEWTVERFEKYARLYRPSAIVCWSRPARAFCRNHPDLVSVSFDDGRILAGTVIGFAGSAIRGRCEVLASPGRLDVRGMVPDLDGLVVLRYHHAPDFGAVRP